MLDVEFEWFDPNPEIDFHGIKSLLSQLFDVDAQALDMSAITDLILSQPLLGSTVKVDGQDTDAYAFLSILNLQQHAEKPFVAQMIRYLATRAASNLSLAPLSSLLTQNPIPPIGLILSDRLINCPSEVVPPMYSMLLEEIEWAIQEKEPYSFTHYLILSKTYTEIQSRLNAEESRPKKKQKAAGGAFETMYFHPEDEILEKHAMCTGGYDYATTRDEGSSDSKRAFQEMGIKPQSHVVLIESSKFKDAVTAVADYLKPSA
jgi:protein BCP1